MCAAIWQNVLQNKHHEEGHCELVADDQQQTDARPATHSGQPTEVVCKKASFHFVLSTNEKYLPCCEKKHNCFDESCLVNLPPPIKHSCVLVVNKLTCNLSNASSEDVRKKTVVVTSDKVMNPTHHILFLI